MELFDWNWDSKTRGGKTDGEVGDKRPLCMEGATPGFSGRHNVADWEVHVLGLT